MFVEKQVLLHAHEHFAPYEGISVGGVGAGAAADEHLRFAGAGSDEDEQSNGEDRKPNVVHGLLLPIPSEQSTCQKGGGLRRPQERIRYSI
jgi:hypothetical protein